MAAVCGATLSRHDNGNNHDDTSCGNDKLARSDIMLPGLVPRVVLS